jgi:hypothetical protein
MVVTIHVPPCDGRIDIIKDDNGNQIKSIDHYAEPDEKWT